jgi:hypothetical protein
VASLAALWNNPTTPEEFVAWTFNHAATHYDINRFVALQYNQAGQPISAGQVGLVLPSYMLDPLDPNDPNAAMTWAYQHQIMHNDQNQVLGIAGQDLLGVAWGDAELMADWLQTHANEHLLAAQKLGIT